MRKGLLVVMKTQKHARGSGAREVAVLNYLKHCYENERHPAFAGYNLLLMPHFHFVSQFAVANQQVIPRRVVVMEILGPSLADLLKHTSPHLPMKVARVIARQICVALSFLMKHQVVHADVKPDNIMLCRPGWTAIKIGDFGMSYIVGRHVEPCAVQTCYYQAPEVCLAGHKGHSIDMWSYGCTLVEMVAKTALFNGVHNAFELCLRLYLILGPPSLEQYAKWKYAHMCYSLKGDQVLLVDNEFLRKSQTLSFALLAFKDFVEDDPIMERTQRYMAELINDILVYDHEKRVTAHRALHYDFFLAHVDEPLDIEIRPEMDRAFPI